jgi:hypothetical protein
MREILFARDDVEWALTKSGTGRKVSARDECSVNEKAGNRDCRVNYQM